MDEDTSFSGKEDYRRSEEDGYHPGKNNERIGQVAGPQAYEIGQDPVPITYEFTENNKFEVEGVLDLKLLDKGAVITGGGKGIGRAIALAFAREGANTSRPARPIDLMEGVAPEIGAFRRKALVNSTDITKVELAERMVKRTFEEFGKIDNSGIAGPTAYVHEITPEEWDETFDVNVRGAFLCCRMAVPVMLRQGGGKIIDIASMKGLCRRRLQKFDRTGYKCYSRRCHVLD